MVIPEMDENKNFAADKKVGPAKRDSSKATDFDISEK